MNELDYPVSNLMMALRLAINDQRRVEKEGGAFRDSAFVAGMEEVYKHLQQGGQLKLIRS